MTVYAAARKASTVCDDWNDWIPGLPATLHDRTQIYLSMFRALRENACYLWTPLSNDSRGPGAWPHYATFNPVVRVQTLDIHDDEKFRAGVRRDAAGDRAALGGKDRKMERWKRRGTLMDM